MEYVLNGIILFFFLLSNTVGRFAKLIRAKRLIMHHFSPRYPGDESPFSLRVMSVIEDQARDASGLWGHKNDVVAAWDHMHTAIPIPDHHRRGSTSQSTLTTTEPRMD